MNELQVLQRVGMATSSEVKELLEKSLRNTIKQLNSLEDRKQISIIIFSKGKIRRRLYILDELYNNIL